MKVYGIERACATLPMRPGDALRKIRDPQPGDHHLHLSDSTFGRVSLIAGCNSTANPWG